MRKRMVKASVSACLAAVMLCETSVLDAAAVSAAPIPAQTSAQTEVATEKGTEVRKQTQTNETEQTTDARTETVETKEQKEMTESQKKSVTTQVETPSATQSVTEREVSDTQNAESVAVQEDIVVTEEEEVVADGVDTPASDFTYTTDEEKKTATITAYKGSATTVVIPSAIGVYTVTEIADKAFYKNENIKTVTIPNTVEKIGSSDTKAAGVFRDCVNLRTVTITEGSKEMYIGTRAFQGCKILRAIVVPGNCSTIYNSAFEDCVLLRSAEYKESTNGITHQISASAFKNCKSLLNLTLGEGLKSIDSQAFYGNALLKDFTFPSSIVDGFIGEKAFYDCDKLTNITIPGGKLYNGVFANCDGLQKVTISSKVTQLGTDDTEKAGVFQNCKALQTVVLEKPKEKMAIGQSVFYGCTALTDIKIPSNYSKIGDKAFYGCTALYSASIPASVTDMGVSAFENCTTLKKIGLPSALSHIPEAAFKRCYALETVTIPKGNKSAAIEKSAFENCSSLKSITLPANYIKIKEAAFKNCTLLQSVSVTNKLLEIQYEAFYGCKNLEDINLQEGITILGGGAFEYCSSLKSIVIPSTVTSLGEYVFAYCSSLSDVLIAKGESSNNIPRGMFYYCISLKDIVIPGNYVYIGHLPFYGCSVLENIYWEEGQDYNSQEIGYYAFDMKYSNMLKKISIPRTVGKIDYNAISTYSVHCVIEGNKGTAAEKFAKEKSFTFQTPSEPLSIAAKVSGTDMHKGDVVSIDASARGGEGIYEYRLLEYDTATKDWNVLVDYQLSSGFTWKSDSSTTKRFCVEVQDGNGDVVRSTAMNVNVDPLSSSLRTNTLKPELGTTVKMVASASGGEGGYTYQFVVYNMNDKKNEYVKDYSSASTITWTPKTAGNRKVYVRVKDKAGQIVKSSELTVSVNEKLSAAAKMATIIGGVKVTGIGAGGDGKYEYKFVMYTPATQKWTLLQNYSATNTYTWKISGTSARQIYVDVRDGNGKTARSAALSVGVGTLKPKVSLTTSATNVKAGTSVKFTAKASDGSGSYQYKFLLQNPTTGKFAVLKDYSTANTYTWKAGGSGKRNVFVDVKDSKGQITRSTAVVVNTTAAVTKPTAKVTANVTKAAAGSKVTVKATATGGSGNYQYRYLLKNPKTGNIVELKGYSSSNTYVWTAGGSGARHLLVDVKDSKGQVTRSAAYGVTVTAQPKKLTASVKADKATVKKGSKVTLTATATGGTGSYQYRFLLKNPTTGKWAELKSYSSANKYVWTAGGENARHVYVDIKDSKGTVIRSSAYGIKITK